MAGASALATMQPHPASRPFRHHPPNIASMGGRNRARRTSQQQRKTRRRRTVDRDPTRREPIRRTIATTKAKTMIDLPPMEPTPAVIEEKDDTATAKRGRRSSRQQEPRAPREPREPRTGGTPRSTAPAYVIGAIVILDNGTPCRVDYIDPATQQAYCTEIEQ